MAGNLAYDPATGHLVFSPNDGHLAWNCGGGPTGSGCIQMGTSGSFVAPATGTLRFQFNDDNVFGNSPVASWTVVVNGVTYSVPNSPLGWVDGPAVTAGDVITYTASGTLTFSSFENAATDPDGVLQPGCTGSYVAGNTYNATMADTGFPCYGLDVFGTQIVKWSLVGKIGP